MAVVQSTYSERMGRAVAGMPADMRNWDGITRSCETAAGITFGVAVGRGDTDPEKGCKLAGALVDFLGVALRDITLDHAAALLDKYAETENVGILTEGSIWVLVTGTPGPDDRVHYDGTTGVFRAAGGGNGPVVGARWMTDTITVGGVDICKLHLSLGNQAAT